MVHEQSCVERDVIVADFVIVPGGNDHGFPPDAIDDKPSGQAAMPFTNRLEGEAFK